MCPNSTCFYATPVWVPDNSTADATRYVPSYPRQLLLSPDAACSDAGNGTTLAAEGALSLDGLSVAVTSTAISGVSMAGATLDFWGADAFNLMTLP